MHKTRIGLILIALVFVPLVASSQFEGIMTIKETVKGSGQTREGRRMTLYIAKDSFRWDQYVMGDMSAGSQIFKREGNTAIMLNTEKKKFCRTPDQEWVDKKNAAGSNPFRRASAEASKTSKTKAIAGFECVEWKISYKRRPDKEPVTYTVWTTDKLGVQASVGFGPEIFESDMAGIVWLKLYDQGLMPLGWSVEKSGGQVSTVEVVSVDKKKVDPAMFEVPRTYTEVKDTSELFK